MIPVPNVEVLTVIDCLTSEPLTEYIHASLERNVIIDFQIINFTRPEGGRRIIACFVYLDTLLK